MCDFRCYDYFGDVFHFKFPLSIALISNHVYHNLKCNINIIFVQVNRVPENNLRNEFVEEEVDDDLLLCNQLMLVENQYNVNLPVGSK